MYVQSTDEEGKVRVFCVEPEQYTVDGTKYTATTAEENIKAALVTLFGSQYDSSLMDALIQTMVWEFTADGYENASNQLYEIHLADQNTSDLSDEDAALISSVKARILADIEAYMEGKTADFTLVEGSNATLRDGVLTIREKKNPVTIVLQAQNADVLSRYNNGQIIYPEGVTGEINLEEGTLTLTIDPTVLTEDAHLALSMIPESMVGETILYINDSNKQSVENFKISNPIFEEIGLVVKPSGGGGHTYVDVTASKVWNITNGGAAANSVTVQLMRDGVAYGNVITLSAANNWTHTWETLTQGHVWSVEEVNVPENFTSSIERNGYTFTITNSDKPTTPDTPSDNPDQPDTPDTPSDNPDKPDTPDTPSDNPDKPDTPDTPSDNPDQPDTPDTPSDNPDKPGTPGTPSDNPGNPGTPGTPSGNPNQPTTTSTTPVSGNHLPQTGQNWMLVGALALAGLALLIVGRRRKEEN